MLLTAVIAVIASAGEKPNIVFIMADDLGYGDLGCYGQERIKTPSIDRMAAEGMRFTQHYSGSTVCAPSRCAFVTGLHTGHAAVRDNEGGGTAKSPYPEGVYGSVGGQNTPAIEDPWAHRSIQMKCRTCMWYAAKPADSIVLGGPRREPLGRCRKRAPTMGGYPAVMEMDWCGDHKIDENKV